MNVRTESRSGVGFCGLLAILFIGLKLAGFIDWPWWAVLLPIWGPLAAALVLLVLAVLTVLIAAFAKYLAQ